MAFGKKKQNTKVGNELSEVAKRHNLRVSNPYGYYPEDVDRVLIKFEGLVNQLQRETVKLEADLQQALTDKKIIDGELKRLRFEMSIMEVPDTTTEEDFSMISKLGTINKEVGSMPEKLPEIDLQHKIPLDVVEDEPAMIDELVSQTVNTPKKQVAQTNTGKFAANIFNENGELDII